MSRNRHLHSVLIMTVLTMIFSLFSAVCILAESSVRITRPADGSSVAPGSVAVWTSFDQPSSFSADVIAREYEPITFRVYKENVLQLEQPVYQQQLTFTAEGSYCTSFNLNTEGTYTIQAKVPKTPNEWDSVTFTVSNDAGGSGDSGSSGVSDYSGESINSENAAALSEGKPLRCTLAKANNFMTAYKVTPSESGYYIFFAAGSMRKIKGEVYEGVGDTAFLDYETGDENEGSVCFMADLSGGTTYTFLVQSTVENTSSFFDVGFISKSSGIKMASASEITLTDADSDYTFGVFSGSRIPDSDWVISDPSVVDYSGSSSGSVGKPDYSGYYNHYAVKLDPRKNGTATVRLVDSNTQAVYASCKITCKGIPEINDSPDKDNQSGSTSNGNASGSNASGSNTSGNSASGSNASGSSTSGSTGGKTAATGPKAIKPVIKLSKTRFTWNKKVQTPKITVLDGKTVLGNASYTVSLPKGRKNIGTYTIKVTLKGSYSGSGTATYQIIPKGTSLSSVKAAKKSLTVKWKKQTAKMPKKRINGYQIQYSMKKNFKSGVKTVNVKSVKKASAKISKLKSGKTYYVRIRTYMKVSGKTYYSGWSKVKKAKVK